MAQGVTYVTPSEMVADSVRVDGTWEQFDIGGHGVDTNGDSGDVVGCIVEVWFPSALTFGFQHGDSIADRVAFGGTPNGDHMQYVVGVNSSDIFECNFSAWASVEVWLVGYVVSAAGYFRTDVDLIQPTVINTWETFDIKTLYGQSGDAIAANSLALFNHEGNRLNDPFGLRPNGSADTLTWSQRDTATTGLLFSGLDASGVMEYRSSDISGSIPRMMFAGYLKDGYYTDIDAKVDYTPTIDATSYYDVTVTEPTESSDGVFVLFQTDATSTRPNAFFRRNGDTIDKYAASQVRVIGGFFVGTDASDIFEMKGSSVSGETIWVTGWVKDGAGAGGGVTVPALDEGMLVGGLQPLAGGLA